MMNVVVILFFVMCYLCLAMLIITRCSTVSDANILCYSRNIATTVVMTPHTSAVTGTITTGVTAPPTDGMTARVVTVTGIATAVVTVTAAHRETG